MPKFSIGEIALVQSKEGGAWKECEILEYMGGPHKLYFIHIPSVPGPNHTGNWWVFEGQLRKKDGPAKEWFEKNIKIKELA